MDDLNYQVEHLKRRYNSGVTVLKIYPAILLLVAISIAIWGDIRFTAVMLFINLVIISLIIIRLSITHHRLDIYHEKRRILEENQRKEHR